MSSIIHIPQPRPDLLQGIATMTAAGINEAHRLYTYPLDVQGAAAAFQWLFAYGDGCDDVRPYPGLAYDPRRGGWREWWGGHGWRERESVLPDMMNIVAVLCANHADMSNWAEGTAQAADPDKVERDYHKLRQRHLGATVERAVKLAAAQCAVKDWDTDPDMLGLPDGHCLYLTPTNPKVAVHDVSQDAADYITRSFAAVPETPSRLWLDFLQTFTGGDLFLEHALQVWTAAALLAGNTHHKAHIFYGDGGTGKSTFLKTVQAAAGDYAASARAAVFVDEKANHPAELLPFIEKRLVVLPELPRGALRSDLLKTVTGGDAISVRGMRQNPRTATPSATLMFSANELPSIRLVDNALRRRLLIWPCENKPEFDNPHLDKILASPEHIGGVVGWLKQALIKYLRLMASGQPMPIPDAVQAATAAYFEEADVIGQWTDSWTTDGGETPAVTLYQSFSAWCQGRNRRPLSERTFGLWLGRHYEKRHTRQGNCYPVTLNTEYQSA